MAHRGEANVPAIAHPIGCILRKHRLKTPVMFSKIKTACRLQHVKHVVEIYVWQQHCLAFRNSMLHNFVMLVCVVVGTLALMSR